MSNLMNVNLGSLEFSGTGDKKTATTSDTLINGYTLPLLDADKYVYRLTSESETQEFKCNYVSDGTNWVTFSYKVDSMDAISCRINKNDGRTELNIRVNLIHVDLTTDKLELFELDNTPNTIKGCVVRLVKDKAVMVTYDEKTQEYKMEVL